jgi:hypothetical protein
MPHNQLLRRFKNIRFGSSAAMALTIDEFKELCQQAKIVRFDSCKFPNFDALKERIVACGDLLCLEISHPEVDNSEKPKNRKKYKRDVQEHSKSPKQKIETLVLGGSSEIPELELFEMIHNVAIDLVNLELEMWQEAYRYELPPLVLFLKKHYQDKLRKLNVYNDSLLSEVLKGFPLLQLRNLTTYHDLDGKNTCDFIRSQPTITDLKFIGIPVDDVFRNLPLLTVLTLAFHSVSDLGIVRKNAQHLRTLTCLNLSFNYSPGSSGCDITFISKMPNLQKFSCSFDDELPRFVKLAPIEKPMLQMKQFFLECYTNKELNRGVKIDAESMWNIFHKMPNLEKITLLEETMKVCILISILFYFYTACLKFTNLSFSPVDSGN